MIKKIYVTEKSSLLNEQKCYVFLVNNNVTKIDLKKFIHKTYDVKVNKVNVLKKLGKKVRKGKVIGRSLTYKKAYVFVDESIPLLEEAA